ncbi:MAG: adenylate/guanylate cyclase domain-containing protein [Treponema sp.]|nr:adenylate/guanylate cyclase domain-containing protein [Treponema sp.]
MDINIKYIARMVRLYGLIVIISNIIAILVPSVASTPIVDSENMKIWEDFISSHKISNLALLAAFLIPSLVCIIYSAKAIRSSEKLLRSIPEIPSVFSLSSVIGWNAYYLIEIPFVIYAKIHLGIAVKYILITSWAFALFSGMTAYTISYILIEILNRMVLLPKVFPQGHLPKNGFSVRPVFKHLMFFSFMVSSVFPVVLLLTSLISVEVNNQLPINRGIIFISLILLLFSFIIYRGLTQIIISPLNKLTISAKRITEGDYKTSVGVVTSDELGLLSDAFNDMALSLAEKEFMRDTFGKVVDPEVRDFLMKNNLLQNGSLGGQTKTVTVLFCDIRSFTSMSEKMAADQVVNLLNRYFTVLGNCITKHHGIINKYIGDAIMAIFGAPVESENSARDAIEAALDMRKNLAELNESLEKNGLPAIRFGIGIHTGNVFAGTIGAQNRMEYTVIGDTVNTASRIENLCKNFKVDLLVSQASENMSGLELNFLSETEIRGKEEKMKVYTL